jgi:YHS domain-containing protein
MEVDPAKAPARSNYQGKIYYFCSEECKTQFDKEPKTFARTDAPAPQAR